MSKDRNKTNNMFGFDEGVDDEYFINEIIGIEEFPYEEFIKEDKKLKDTKAWKQTEAFINGTLKNDGTIEGADE